MSDPHIIWSFTREDLFLAIGLSPEDNQLLESKADDFAQAILAVAPEWEADFPDGRNHGGLSSTAALLIPHTQFHLKLSAAARPILIGAAGIVAKACLLNQLRLVDLSVSLTTMAIVNLLNQITKLTPRQRQIIETIYDLKRASPSPPYWPTTEQIADKLKLAPAEIDEELRPLLEKVVQYDGKKQSWKVLM